MQRFTHVGGKGACSSFIDRCFAFIGENAVETVKTTSFCTLPKDALVKLISSDYLGLEEEDVWRAVLNWAKYQVSCFKFFHNRSYVSFFQLSFRRFTEETNLTISGRRYSANAALDRGRKSPSLSTFIWGH